MLGPDEARRGEEVAASERASNGELARSKQVLDPCCGGRSFYFDSGNPDVLMCDLHPRESTLCDGRVFRCEPDLVSDFADMPFGDESFNLVVFDPPHLVRGSGWQVEKYGKLPQDFKAALGAGFSECWRVLRPGGTMVFKWNEYQVPMREIEPLFPATPLLGHRRPGASKTHWLVFYKPAQQAG